MASFAHTLPRRQRRPSCQTQYIGTDTCSNCDCHGLGNKTAVWWGCSESGGGAAALFQPSHHGRCERIGASGGYRQCSEDDRCHEWQWNQDVARWAGAEKHSEHPKQTGWLWRSHHAVQVCLLTFNLSFSSVLPVFPTVWFLRASWAALQCTLPQSRLHTTSHVHLAATKHFF